MRNGSKDEASQLIWGTLPSAAIAYKLPAARQALASVLDRLDLL